MPAALIDTFTRAAFTQCPNTEFMGWLLGTRAAKTESVSIRGIFCPRQESTATTVWESSGSSSTKLVEVMEQTATSVLGWVHTHPNMSGFLSAVDMHMHQELQYQDPLSLAIVIDGDRQPHYFRLTEVGMTVVGACKQPGFHTHEGFTQDELVETVPVTLLQQGKQATFFTLFEDEPTLKDKLKSIVGVSTPFHVVRM
jgi:proteasome lid subunit RPN8/RPN11